MKIRFIYLISIAAVSAFMSACSSDTDDEIIDYGNSIDFSVAVPNPPRSSSTTTATINNFTVYAFTADKEYMSNVKVSRNGSKWVYTPIVYWPETPVNFFAYSPDISSSVDSDGSGLTDITNYTNSGNVDLLYAVNMNESAKAAPVNINFRHALSRVAVMLSSNNPSITVKIHYVMYKNLYQRASFNYPRQTTSASAPDVVGTWSGFGLAGDVLDFAIIDNSDIVTLGITPVDLTEGTLEHSFFIPQPLVDLAFDGNVYTGNCIEVDCEIYDTASGAKIWPTVSTPPAQLVAQSGAGRLMYPVTTSALKDWKPGHAYIYNIRIDNPAELQTINFDVTVDDYELEQ